MVEVVNVSAYMASWAADMTKQPTLVPPAIAARTARKEALRRLRDGVDDSDVESISPIIQATTIGLDLMNEGSRQPRSTLQHALDSYAEND
ncbi:hypothetical protein [Rhizobium tumorigenes]|uniref:hypothetical protein n=1 Tax=Rhizobium tumorigenes TaxID=2041385 RepID=UPI00241C7764|nr:hypothetical protein [Rhizobium tumorigenes]WFS02466.1 hypothetical protein PR016_07640 [Rhizobium tumorigenes]